MYLRLVGITSFLPTPFKKISKLINPLLRALQFFTFLPAAGYNTEVVSRSDFLKNKDYALFLDRWLREQKNALIKSPDFLAWRTGAPESTYYFINLKHNKELVGFALVRPTTLKGIASLAILDISILREHFKGSRSIHRAIFKLAHLLEKDVIACMTSFQWAKNYRLFSSLYVPTNAVFSLIVKKLDDQISDLHLFTSNPWHLFWIDSDDL